jgi:4-amino-4-deoxy-L-arabinose transferase-like glycosyltransferase
MSFSEGRLFLILKRIVYGREFVPSKRLAQSRTVPRFWDEPFLLFVPMQTAFGCFYQGIRKWLFRQRLRRPRQRASLRLLLLLLLSPSAAGAFAVANIAIPTAC